MFKNIPFNSQDVKDVKKSLSKLTHKPLYNKKIKNFVESFHKFYDEELCKDGEKKKFFKEAAAQMNKAKDKFHKIATDAIAASEYWTERTHKGNMKSLLKKTCCVQKKLLDGLIETAAEDANKSENSSGKKLAQMIKDHTEKHSNLCKRGRGDKCHEFDWPDTKEAKAQCNSLLTTQALYATKVDIF